MFYSAESLKKGGRFDLCWLADCWPQRFSRTKHKELLSKDIREICEDLQDLMNSESGRSTRRYSLRLSSQVTRGLVRLYKKQVDLFLGDTASGVGRAHQRSSARIDEETEPTIEDLDTPSPSMVVLDYEMADPITMRSQAARRHANDYEVPSKKPRHSDNWNETEEEFISNGFPQEPHFNGKYGGMSNRHLSRFDGSGSYRSETPGSWSRTSVSLGDSSTRDTMRFLREEWGLEGTMLKILYSIVDGISPLNIESLIARGPSITGYKKVIVATCFTSLLKLKQHSYIRIVRDPTKTGIRDIKLGPKFVISV